ncbi:MAG: hypothetical protein DRP29_01420 [Thermodesulfobacteriota bacterium]|nr:MAG: hypothetical protein DRP29_01420 [Thermodesulfobacteriota bacterium]RLG13097.1 MAG: hypothetical protein DRN73_00355 [Candidatus Pacearchaeota archaeon]
MQKFKDLIYELALPPKIKKSIIALNIACKYWKEIVGEKFYKYSKPVFFDEGILVVETSNHYFSQILLYNSLDILKKLNELTPLELKPLFKNIKFKINPFIVQLNKKKEKRNSITKEDKEAYFKVCERIKDEELRESFKRLLRSYIKACLQKDIDVL